MYNSLLCVYDFITFKSTHMKTKMILFFALFFAFSVSGVNAQNYHESKQQRERNSYGYKHGKKSQQEARRLAQQEKYFQKEIRRAKCDDGRVSRAERARIMRKQQMANRHNYSYNHNKRNRF